MKSKVIVIIGPTATNKTKVAIQLANKLNGEIINADAFQIYKELNIGTNKPTPLELRQATFHLISNKSIYDKWDIKRFQQEAKKIITHITKLNKIPIIVGGSHLYVDALIKNYDFSLSNERDNSFNNFTNQELFQKLNEFNNLLASKIGINNRKRLIRALQTKGKLIKRKKEIYVPFYLLCTNEREVLYNKINKRVDKMIKEGWINEVKKLYNENKDLTSLNAFKAIGYNEILTSIINNKNIDIDRIKRDTRHYAKRQMTWIRHHYDNVCTYNQNNISDVIKRVKQWLEK
ncbi:MAG: tRNA (adenosine(37)-N6)-dimethylallyltransferase MiaA [Mycoplasmataceae bacterium]|nr:tRNA (adenosine(37)-N6)-dimethylallyltransferase MiaA [Mycoplasmataceae bacterium]